MKNNNSGVRNIALFLTVISIFFGGVFFAGANTESDDRNDDSPEKKMFWLEVKDRAKERKEQVEKNQERRQMMVEDRKALRQEKICENLAERSSKLREKLGDQYEKISERKVNRSNVFDEKRTERDATLDEKRADRDVNREKMYAELLERAGDDMEKKAAVSVFQSAVETAVSDRKKAVDAAIVAFRSGVDAAIGSRKNTMDANIADFKSAVEKATSQVKSDCEAGKDPASVRTSFETSLKAARAKVADDRAAAEKVGVAVSALAETKRAAFLLAHETFKTAMEKARTNLKAAFGTSGNDESEE